MKRTNYDLIDLNSATCQEAQFHVDFVGWMFLSLKVFDVHIKSLSVSQIRYSFVKIFYCQHTDTVRHIV